MTALIVAAGWAVTLLVAIAVPRKAAKPAHLAVALATVAFAAIWSAPLLPSSSPAAKRMEPKSSAGASCATVDAGQTEQAVQARLGEASEVRSEEELRGPGAKVWIYRQSRCAVHLLDGLVESVD